MEKYHKNSIRVISRITFVLALILVSLCFVGRSRYYELEMDHRDYEMVLNKRLYRPIDSQSHYMYGRYLSNLVGDLNINEREFNPKTSNFRYKISVTDKEVLADTTTDGEFIEILSKKYKEYTVVSGVDANFKVWDQYKWINIEMELLSTFGSSFLWFIVLFGVVALYSLYVFICTIGRLPDKEGISLKWYDHLPLEAYGFVLLVIYLIYDSLRYVRNQKLSRYFVMLVLVLHLLNTLIKRIKSKTIFTSSLVYRFIMYLKDEYLNLPLVRKGVLTFVMVVIINFVLLMVSNQLMFLLSSSSKLKVNPFMYVLALEIVVFAYLLIRVLLSLRSLEHTAQIISEGNVEYQMDVSKLMKPFKGHGDTLNRINDSVERAVADQTKSERMKTELITNVSHDIKTPLTSIINYVDLLKKEDLNNSVARSYLEPLDRQSKKLGTLVDNLLIASRVSSGNVETVLQALDLNVFLEQTAGEFRDRLDKAGVSLIMNLSEDRCFINADTDLLSRSVDNLISNVVKYSLEGSRAYLGLEVDGKRVSIIVRNISRDIFTGDKQELMERFVRGDSSRNTDGNGLGLSIAKSMVELQGGDFDIILDGDLFKVICTFDLI